MGLLEGVVRSFGSVGEGGRGKEEKGVKGW